MKLDITQEFYKELLDKALRMKIEERDLALDRYRKQDDVMETSEDFMLLGRNAASFLKLGADCSNDIIRLAKEIKDLVFDGHKSQTADTYIDDSIRQAIIDSRDSFENSSDYE